MRKKTIIITNDRNKKYSNSSEMYIDFYKTP